MQQASAGSAGPTAASASSRKAITQRRAAQLIADPQRIQAVLACYTPAAAIPGARRHASQPSMAPQTVPTGGPSSGLPGR